jgi:hypothetical protein
MVKEYAERMYAPALCRKTATDPGSASDPIAPPRVTSR